LHELLSKSHASAGVADEAAKRPSQWWGLLTCTERKYGVTHSPLRLGARNDGLCFL